MISTRTLKNIEKLAIQIDWNQSFGGKSRGNKHLTRVIAIADFLAKELGADRGIVRAGALLHDVALPTGNDYDYDKNKRVVTRLLKDFPITSNERRAIAECVASHEGTAKPKTLEAEIVHDADVLEKSGILGLIRHTWKRTNLENWFNEGISSRKAQEVVRHIRWRRKQLRTSLARKIHDYLHLEIDLGKLLPLVRKISMLAAKGIVTEKIAIALTPDLAISERKKLQEQLNVSYLRKFSGK